MHYSKKKQSKTQFFLGRCMVAYRMLRRAAAYRILRRAAHDQPHHDQRVVAPEPDPWPYKCITAKKTEQDPVFLRSVHGCIPNTSVCSCIPNASACSSWSTSSWSWSWWGCKLVQGNSNFEFVLSSLWGLMWVRWGCVFPSYVLWENNKKLVCHTHAL